MTPREPSTRANPSTTVAHNNLRELMDNADRTIANPANLQSVTFGPVRHEDTVSNLQPFDSMRSDLSKEESDDTFVEASDSLHDGAAQDGSHSSARTSLEVHTSGSSDTPADIDAAAGQALADALDTIQSQLDGEQPASEQQFENEQQSENESQSEDVQQPTGSEQDPADPASQSGPEAPATREYGSYTNAPLETTTNRFGRTVNKPDYSKGRIVEQ